MSDGRYDAVAPVTCSKYARSSCLANCYCRARLAARSEEVGYLRAVWDMAAGSISSSSSSSSSSIAGGDGDGNDGNDDSALCGGVLFNVARDNALSWVAVVALACVNVVMTVVLKCLTRFERHPSAGDENNENLLKIFISRFLNSAVVVSE